MFMNRRPRDGVDHTFVGHVEVVNAQEQTDATAELLSDHTSLLVAICPSKEQACLASHRSDHYPALRSSIVCQRRSVLH